MPGPNLELQSRLSGACVFLSASIPTLERRDEYERIMEAPTRIEEAVVCIARAIFVEGGTLVFGAHPSISPLVAYVIQHYYLPAPAEEVRDQEGTSNRSRSGAQPDTGEAAAHLGPWHNPSLIMYQSQVWKKEWAEKSKQLARNPLVQVKWIRRARGEKVDATVKNRPQAPKSMEIMRRSMIGDTVPSAMIAVGGMKGVLDEARIFSELRPGRPIYALETTGGAAALLHKQESCAKVVRMIDRKATDLVRDFWTGQQSHVGLDAIGPQRSHEQAEQRRDHYVPYAFIAQQIVTELVSRE